MAKYKIMPSSRTIVQSPISIGHKAEKGVEAIEFDLTAWVETYGSGTATIIMRRWGDAIPYPIALEIDENNKATWTLSDTDTAKAGMAYAQLSYIVGDEVVKKSDIYTFRVMDSLTGEGEPPEAYESWLEHLTHLAAEAMAEVLDIEGVVTDKTLTVDGGIADAKATGDALSALEDAVTEETDKLKADLGAIGTKKQASDYVWNIGEIKASGSNGTSSVHARLNDFVQVSAGDMITFDISTYVYKIFFYSSNVASSCIGNTEFDDSDWTYTVESDCYVRICVKNNPSHTMTADDRDRIAASIYFVSAGSLFKDVADVEQDTTKALAGLDTYSELIIDGRARNLFAESKAVDGYLNGTGGVQRNNFTTLTSDFIKLDPSETYLTLQTWQELPSGITQWQAYAFYDSSKANVGGRFVRAQEEVNYQAFEKAIPSNAVYVRVSSRAYGNHKIMLQYGRTCSAFEYAYEDINAIRDSVAALNAAPSNDTCVKAVNHRGWSACPENTLTAYKASKRHGFNIVETDVQFTSDNVPVLLHDGTINRTARNADGTTISGDISIKNITYAEALDYDFGIYKGTEFAGEPIPTLAEFLRLCKRLGLKAYVEIKNDATFTSAQIQSVVDEVIKAGMIDAVTFISFSHDFLGVIKEYAPSVRLGLITTTLAVGYVQRALALKTATNEVFIDSDKWNTDGVQACISENMPLEVWTVDSESTLLGLPDYVTGVTSNSLIASKVLENAVLG